LLKGGSKATPQMEIERMTFDAFSMPPPMGTVQKNGPLLLQRRRRHTSKSAADLKTGNKG
jgi:hypothetical protein